MAGGASYDKGSVPAATCQVTDAEDGNSSFAATLSAITGPYASDGIGSQTASCSYTDEGGLDRVSVGDVQHRRPERPGDRLHAEPGHPDGDNGWYTATSRLTWTVTEPQSPNSLQKTGCVDQTITADQANDDLLLLGDQRRWLSRRAVGDHQRDGTAPAVSTTASPRARLAPTAGTPPTLTVQFTATDATSGLSRTRRARRPSPAAGRAAAVTR